MWETTSRTFEVLGMLQRRGFISSDSLASTLGVTTRTVRRDVARLRDLGYPVESRVGVDGGYSLEPGAVLPPLFFSSDEALACALALRRWRDGTDPTLPGSALGKLVMSLSPRVRWMVDAVSKVTLSVPVDALQPVDDRPVDVGLLGDLARACQLRRRLEFCYTKRDGQTVVRRADPRSLVNTVRRWYLVAFDNDAGEWRTYRVDHVSEVQVMDFPARSHEFPGRNVEEWVTGQLAAGWQQVTATVRVHAPREAVSRWVAPAWGVVEEESPGVTIVRAGADTYESIARWLLLVQSDIDVIEPDELRAAFRRVARQADRAGRE